MYIPSAHPYEQNAADPPLFCEMGVKRCMLAFKYGILGGPAFLSSITSLAPTHVHAYTVRHIR